MKQLSLSLLLVLTILGSTYAQSGPPWKILKEESKEAIYFRILRQNNVSILQLKVVHPDLTSINAHQLLYLKLGNDFAKLAAQQNAKACKGCGTFKIVSYHQAMGIDVRYAFSQSAGQSMMKGNLQKMRIVTADGNIDADIPSKNQGALRKALQEFYGG